MTPQQLYDILEAVVDKTPQYMSPVGLDHAFARSISIDEAQLGVCQDIIDAIPSSAKPEDPTLLINILKEREGPHEPFIINTGLFGQPDVPPLAKPKPKPRDPETRAERAVEALLRDPELAGLVKAKLAMKRFAKPWKRTFPDVWVRELFEEYGTAAYLKNHGTLSNGGDGTPNWRLVACKGDTLHELDHTDDPQAGRDAIDFYLVNTGWVLL
jgi:hypothetical protein